MTPSRASTISVSSAVATAGLCITIFAYMTGRIDRVEDKLSSISIPRAEVTTMKEAADKVHDAMQHDIDMLRTRLDTLIIQQNAILIELRKNGNHKQARLD